MARSTARRTVVAAVGLGTALALTACGSGTPGEPSGGDQTADSATTIEFWHRTFTPVENEWYKGIVEQFNEAQSEIHVKVTEIPADAWDQKMKTAQAAGKAPDVYTFSGSIHDAQGAGQLLELNDIVPAERLEEMIDPAKAVSSIDGTYYAYPLLLEPQTVLFWNETMLEAAGVDATAAPETWDDLIALSDQIVEDHAAEGKKPWCAGIASDAATGWPVTDWMEDMVLRTGGPDVYDQWVSHEIAFNSEVPTQALDAVGAYLKNPDYVNGGFGDVSSIATTAFQDGGLPILEGQCSLHRMASFYAANFPKGTDISENGQIFAFYLPGKTAEDKPVLGAGEFVTAFADRRAAELLGPAAKS